MCQNFLFQAELYSIVWIYHVLLIHLSVDTWVALPFGYCEYCCMNASVQNLFKCLLSLLLSIYTEVEPLDHMVVVCFVMKKWTWLKIISQSFCRVSFNLDLDSDYMFWLECHRCFFLFESYSTRWQVMFIWFLVFLTLIHFIVLLTARWIYCKIIVKSLCNY